MDGGRCGVGVVNWGGGQDGSGTRCGRCCRAVRREAEFGFVCECEEGV